jgi:cellulose synthase/poly-beta-1,6-N-acetylglucosamine synthase-like glycosyltransferase
LAQLTATTWAVALFWSAFALLLYVYLGYPLLAWMLRKARPRPVVRAPIEPSVTVIVVAHNEGHRIERRIENLLSSDYPRERLAIVIGSDGSTDDTVQRALRYRHHGVTVRTFSRRRGKPAVLNELIAAAEGEIIVLADARQRFEPDAIRTLVANFADPEVGAVSGELHLRKRRGTSPGGEGTGLYWKYEKFIRANESWIGSTIGATGAIYAIRRHLFEPIPPDTILDDVLIPMQIVRKGYRVLFETRARAHDLIAMNPREDFIRKARTIAGTFQLFARDLWMLNPLSCCVWFQALSHKALRLAIPVLHLAIFVANVALIGDVFYRMVLVAQVMFYVAALMGYFQARPERSRRARIERRRIARNDRARRMQADRRQAPRAPKRTPVFTIPYTMVLLGWATIVGFSRIVARRQRVTWERMPGEPGPRVVSRPVLWTTDPKIADVVISSVCSLRSPW